MSTPPSAGNGPVDIIEFRPNLRYSPAGMIGEQPALPFIPSEAEDNSADAADAEAEYEGEEDAHGVIFVSCLVPALPTRT